MLDKKSIENDRIGNIPGYKPESIHIVGPRIPCNTCRSMGQIATAFPKGIETEIIARKDNLKIDENINMIKCFQNRIKDVTENRIYIPCTIDSVSSILQKRIDEKKQEIVRLKTTMIITDDLKGKD